MSPLVVRILPAPAATLVTISGEVDIATIAQLRGHLLEVPDRHAVLDLSGLALLSAAGMTELLAPRARLARAAARGVLGAAPTGSRRVPTATDLDAELPVVPTVADALTLLAAGATSRTVPRRAGTATGSCRVGVRRYPSLRESGSGLPRSLRG